MRKMVCLAYNEEFFFPPFWLFFYWKARNSAPSPENSQHVLSSARVWVLFSQGIDIKRKGERVMMDSREGGKNSRLVWGEG